MIKVNNFEQIESLLDFTSSDDFYFVQIIQRKKENPEISHHKSNRTRAIKSYDINSLELFRNKKSEIIELCKVFNARAYIHLTKRSYKKLAFQMQLNIAERCISGNYELMGRVFNTCCGITEVRVKPFNWVVDIDNMDTDVLAEYIKLIESIYVPIDNESAIIDIIPTINGEHLITRPFNVHKFKQDLVINQLEDIDIHKNNPTLLYYEEVNVIKLKDYEDKWI